MLHSHKETARPEHHLWDVFGKGRGDIISLAWMLLFSFLPRKSCQEQTSLRKQTPTPLFSPRSKGMMHTSRHGWARRAQQRSSSPTCAATRGTFKRGVCPFFFFFNEHVDLTLERRQTQLGGGECQILLSNRLRNRHTWIIYARQFVWQIIVSAVTSIVPYVIFPSHLCVNQTCLERTLLPALLVTKPV